MTRLISCLETVLKNSSQPCLGKSANKLNRVYVTAEPLNPALVDDLENKKASLENMTEFTKSLSKDYGWDKSETVKLWWFEGTCCLVDMSHAVPYLTSVKDHLINACKQVCAEGILAGEPLRGKSLSPPLLRPFPQESLRLHGDLLPLSSSLVFFVFGHSQQTLTVFFFRCSI